MAAMTQVTGRVSYLPVGMGRRRPLSSGSPSSMISSFISFKGTGKTHLSFKEKRLVAIERDQGKCILCGQCTRICDEVVGKGIIDLVGRGFVPTTMTLKSIATVKTRVRTFFRLRYTNILQEKQ